MKRGLRRGALRPTIVGALVLGATMVAPALAGGAAAAAAGARVTLAQSVPHIPNDVAKLGATPADQAMTVDVALAGQNAAELAQAVDDVAVPGSAGYERYLTPAEFAATYGPTPAEVSQVSSVLRGEGLKVGTPQLGSDLLPVSGTAATVGSAFGTSLQTVQAPDEARTVVNTSPPSVPSELAGAVTGVVGLNGLFAEHDMLEPTTRSGSTSAPVPGVQSHVETAHAPTPQACSAAQEQAFGGSYTSTQMSSIFGLNQLFGQGRTGIGQTIGVVEFEQYLQGDFQAFQSCYGLSNPIRNEVVDGPVGGSPSGQGEAALDVELASYNAPSAALVVYEAPNNSDVAALDLFQRIASDDSTQVVTTSWGNCEAIAGSDVGEENEIFAQMAMQGQTVIAAAGDAGSEDCFPNSPSSTELAIDDPGAQPYVVSAGGTTLSSGSASSQSVWNDCLVGGVNEPAVACADDVFHGSPDGAGGGGYSQYWGRVPGQPIAGGPDTDPCGDLSGCRSVPDISYPGDPSNGGVVAYFDGSWTAFGGTSVAAPTNAGLFADTNQGCYFSLGDAVPKLYTAEGENSDNFTDVTSGNNDFTDTNGGDWTAGAGYDTATGLGTPVDQNLAITLQGADGCPSVAGVIPDTGPLGASPAITVYGGGFANATSVTFGSLGAGQIIGQSATSITVIPPNATGPICVNVSVQNSQGISVTTPYDQYGFGGDLNCGQGYRFVATDGGIFDFGSATFYGSRGGQPLNAPIVGMAVTPSTNGYWMVASDGGIFSYGDANYYGSMGGRPLNKPIVGIASAADGRGYWMVASDGGIFNFGTANFYGSMGGKHLNAPIVGMAATPDGGGYWEVASDGGIFTFGDANYYGSMGGKPLNKPIVGMATGPNGQGYWMVASDGGIFNFGTANFDGSRGGQPLNKPIVGMAASPDGGGYWLVASDGGIFNYGDANFYGSTGNLTLNKPIVGMSSA